jgi:hypothetical protein
MDKMSIYVQYVIILRFIFQVSMIHIHTGVDMYVYCLPDVQSQTLMGLSHEMDGLMLT